MAVQEGGSVLHAAAEAVARAQRQSMGKVVNILSRPGSPVVLWKLELLHKGDTPKEL